MISGLSNCDCVALKGAVEGRLVWQKVQATRGELPELNWTVEEGRICYDIDEVLRRHHELLDWLPQGAVEFIRSLLSCDPLQRISLADAIKQCETLIPHRTSRADMSV